MYIEEELVTNEKFLRDKNKFEEKLKENEDQLHIIFSNFDSIEKGLEKSRKEFDEHKAKMMCNINFLKKSIPLTIREIPAMIEKINFNSINYFNGYILPWNNEKNWVTKQDLNLYIS